MKRPIWYPFFSCNAKNKARGFTLVELILVIVILGVIGGMVSVFMRSPIDAYFSSARRAALTDLADTLVRRMTRDIQRALPNSIRSNGPSCLEFIPTKTGGRYRTSGTGALVFTGAVTSFNMLGDYSTFAGSSRDASQTITSGDRIVVYNLGIAGADAYAGDNWSDVTSVGTVSAGETPININSKLFPLESDSGRFQVVSSTERLVSYVCSGTNLYRNVSNSAWSTTPVCATTGGALIGSNVNCGGTSFVYSGSDLQRNALVNIKISVQDSSATETVTLQHEVHVSNTP